MDFTWINYSFNVYDVTLKIKYPVSYQTQSVDRAFLSISGKSGGEAHSKEGKGPRDALLISVSALTWHLLRKIKDGSFVHSDWKNFM